MPSIVRRISGCSLVMILILAPRLAEAQSRESMSTGAASESELIKLESNPSGAIVKLDGLYSFTGRTPFVVPYEIFGNYKVKAMKEGYETLSTDRNFSGTNAGLVMITLNPKTRFKAAYRSLFFPGWGQIYGGNRSRGIVISAIQLSLGIRSLFVINDYNNSQDAADRALHDFERNPSEAAFQSYQNKLQIVQDDYNLRKTMLALTAGFWVYNILDSVFFFSTNDRQIEIVMKPLAHSNNDKNMMFSFRVGL